MEQNRPEKSSVSEREEILRALSELDTWFDERRNAFLSLQKFIQHGLQSGRLTECRNKENTKRHLSPRMIATLRVDQNQLVRSMLLFYLRKKELNKRLEELDSEQKATPAA